MPDGTRKAVTRRTGPNGERWTTERDAKRALRAVLVAADKGELVDPSKQQVGAYLDEWLAGLRLAPSTVASYRKNVRLHLAPHIGAVPLASLTTARIDALYRQLERGGRADHKAGEGLSPRTVRYVHTILSAALGAAVKLAPPGPQPGRRRHAADRQAGEGAGDAPVDRCPARRVPGAGRPSTASITPLWTLLAMTGMRRGEALALRWRDVDLDAGTVSVRRSAGVVRVKGEGAAIVEGDTKSGKPRVVDLDAADGGRAARPPRASAAPMALQLARDDALVFGDLEGRHLHPEQFSRTVRTPTSPAAARRSATDALPVIRLHDLRHTHATILLTAREPVHVVSQRLGHASA